LYLDALTLLDDRSVSLVTGIGVIYALYALYSTQLCEPLVPVPISFRHEMALLSLRAQLSSHAAPVPDAVLDAWQADSTLLRSGSYCNVAPGTWAQRPSAEAAARLLERVARHAGATVRLNSSITRPLPRESSLLTVVNVDAIAKFDADYAAAKQAIHLPPGVPQLEWSAFHDSLSHVQVDLGATLAVKARQAADERAQQIAHDLSEQEAQPKSRRTTSVSSSSSSSRRKSQQVTRTTASTFAPPPRTSKRVRKPKAKLDDDDIDDIDTNAMSFELPPPPVAATTADGATATTLVPVPREFPRDEREFCEICKVPDDSVEFFIGCEECNAWFHGNCLRPPLTPAEASAMDVWYCDKCVPRAINAAPPT
jgi:hypothetical protein